jgi:dihydrodipicolinate reductase
MKLKVCVAGATGRVGKPLCAAVSEADDLRDRVGLAGEPDKVID